MKLQPKACPRLLSLRKRSGLSLDEVGSVVKIAATTIARYERGLRPSDKHARALEHFYGAKRDSLADKTVLAVVDTR